MPEISSAHQRYYHVVVFGRHVPWTLATLWKALGAYGTGFGEDSFHDWGRVDFRTLRTPEPLGATDTEGSPARRDRDGFYLHDIFAAEIKRGAERFVALGVPYVQLGRSLGAPIRQARLMQSAEFVRADTERLVQAAREGQAEKVGVGIAKVDARVTSHPEIKGFSLSGENAVLSDIYSKIVGDINAKRARSGNGETSKALQFSHCTVRVLHRDDGAMSIHCDSHGNFRVWVQKHGRNLGMLRHWVHGLRRMRAEALVSDYPLYRKHNEEE